MRTVVILLLLAALPLTSCRRDGDESASPTAGADGAATAAPVAPPRDVLLVMVDTLRADHLHVYGYERETSPYLDELAAAGVRFDHVRANCSWTRPSMASALSGLQPPATGVHDERSFDLLVDDVVLLSERLHDAGYATAGVTANPNLNAVFGFRQGFDHYVETEATWHWMNPDQKRHGAHLDADGVNRAALELAAGTTGPIYLQLVYLEPHTPLRPPKEYAERFVTDEMDKRQTTVAKYDAEIAYVDQAIRELVAGLAELGRADPLIVFFSDHGEGLYDHRGVPNSREHGFVLYESNLRVPWILHHPSLPAGTVIREPVQLVDLVPTVLELVGQPVPDGLHGVSLAPEVRGERRVARPDHVVSVTDRSYVDKIGVWRGGHKLIVNRDSEALAAAGDGGGAELKKNQRRHLEMTPVDELYDLGALAGAAGDGGPARPRAEHPDKTAWDAPAEVRAELRALIDAWETAYPSRPAVRAGEEDVGEELIEQLRALGYLD